MLKGVCAWVIVGLKRRIIGRLLLKGGCGGTKIDFVLMKGSQKKFLKDVKAIEGELQHKLLKGVLDGRWIRKSQQSQAKKYLTQKYGSF